MALNLLQHSAVFVLLIRHTAGSVDPTRPGGHLGLQSLLRRLRTRLEAPPLQGLTRAGRGSGPSDQRGTNQHSSSIHPFPDHNYTVNVYYFFPVLLLLLL